MILINGRGQLGIELQKYVLNDHGVMIYHTWDFIDKSEDVQKECYKKFKKFIGRSFDKKIAFISTYTTNWTPYLKYKLMSELYLLENISSAKVFRLPNLIGKGVCKAFKLGLVKPNGGSIEIMSPEQAAWKIYENIHIGDWNEKIVRIRGTVTTPQLVYDLIRFGAK